MAELLVRVRLPSGETAKIRIPSATSHQALLEQAAHTASLDLSACHLSLNKKDPLRAGALVPISEIGISHGDLIYLMMPGQVVEQSPTPLVTRVVSPGSSTAAAAMARAAAPVETGTPAATSSVSIDQLVEMGFDAAAAQAALVRTSNRVDEAVVLLTASTQCRMSCL